MIIDRISALRSYVPLLPDLGTVADVLSRLTLAEFSAGSFATDNPNVRYVVSSYETKTEMPALYEVHEREADVQVLLSGSETMYAAKRLTRKPETYDVSSDAAMVKGKNLLSYVADADTFVLFFPGEPHAPCLADGRSSTVRKVVFKIRLAP